MTKFTRFKMLLLALVMLVGSGNVWGQTTINFDTPSNWVQDGSTSLTSYGAHAYVESGVTIQGTNVIRNTTSVQDGFAGALGTYSMRIGNTAVSKAAITVASGGVANFSIKVRRWDNSPMPNYTVKYSVDGGSNWTSLTNIGSSLLTTSDFFTYSSGVINSTVSNFKIEIQNTGTTERIMIDDFTWTGYTGGGNPVVTTPTFSASTGNYYSSQNITISSSTEGATIYYTTDGTDPDNTDTQYTTPIAVSTTTTIKAIGYKDGMDPSGIATATYTFPTINNVSNIAALRAGTTDGTVYKLTGEALLTLQSTGTGKPKYIQDATGGILVYDSGAKIATTYNIGDGITNIIGTLTTTTGMLQFIPVVDPGVATSTGNTLTPVEIELANLANYPAQLVKVSGVTIDGTGNFVAGTNYNLNSSSTTILRTQYSDLNYVGTAIPAVPQDIVGVVLMYNTIAELVPRSTSDFSNTVYASPTILVSEATVPAMTAQVGATDTETITVNAQNLTESISLAVTGTDASLFTLSTYSIAPTSGTVTDQSVTITYTPTTAGSHTATLTLSSAGATDVVKTLSGSATWPPLAAPVAEAAGAISQSGFTAIWGAVSGATSYQVNVYTKGGSEEATVFSENFNGFTNGTADSGANSTDVSTSLDTKTQSSGWTGSKVYEAGGTIKLGGSSSLGYIVTPSINLSANSGNFTLKFDAMAWSGDATEFKIYLDDVLAYTVTGLNNSTYTFGSFTINLTGGTATSKLKFEGKQASKGRFFLENLVITQNGSTKTQVSGSPFTVTGETTKAVTGLSASTTYYYTVVAKNVNVDSDVSNEISVVTSFGTGVDAPALQNITAFDGKIRFSATAGQQVEVYNAVGQKLMSAITLDGLNTLNVNAKGMMIVKVGDRLAKVIL